MLASKDHMSKIFIIIYLLTTFLILSCNTQKTTINISSNIAPITRIILREYKKINPKYNLKINIIELEENNIDYIKLPIALDAIALIINKQNTWASKMKTSELQKLWNNPQKNIKWNDIRPEWPNKKINYWSLPNNTETYKYFNKTIKINTPRSISNHTQIKNHQALIKEINNDKYSIGYLKYSHCQKNKNKLHIVAISHQDKAAISPTPKTIKLGTYSPLTYPIYIHLNINKMKQNKEFLKFVQFYIQIAPNISTHIGYMQLPDTVYKRNTIKLKKFSLY